MAAGAVDPIPNASFITESFDVHELKPNIFESCCELWSIAFAKPGRDKESVIAERTKEINEDDEDARKFTMGEKWHVISEMLDNGSVRVVAAARSFSRMMLFSDGTQRSVFGLAHVASHPDKRGRGLGKKIVQEAFSSRIDNVNKNKEDGSCFIFQSGSPDFYSKIGCKHLVGNEYNFINSTNKGSDAKRIAGFWDSCVLAYPESVEIPLGTIDLQGPGY